MVMAGGRGERLHPLTQYRAKPAVPFGGKFRLIDFVLSNLANSGIHAIYVLMQYKAQSLLEHIQIAWPVHDPRRGEFVSGVPAQMRTGESWYRGTADAIFQNLNLINDTRPDIVAVFGADHVYRMDVSQMVDFHQERKAEGTIAAIPVPIEHASSFGVIQVDATGRVTGFLEKSKEAPPMPGRPGWALASMGNYLFNTKFLKAVLSEDAAKASAHDFGKSILPDVYKERAIYAYDFATNKLPVHAKGEEVGYWRDVGSIKGYFDANMDLKNPVPIFDLYNRQWPIHTALYDDPPAKFVFDEEGRRGIATHSLVTDGCIVSGARVADSILGRNVFVHSYSHIAESILMDGVDVGRHCRIRRAIIDKNVVIEPGTVIGFDPAEDKRRFYVDDESGIVVIPKAEASEVD